MGDLWVPIIAMFLSIGGPVIIAIVVLMNRHTLAKQKYDRIQKALESGKTPEEVERMIEAMEKTRTKPPRRRTGYFRLGIILIGASVSTLIIGRILEVRECMAAAGGGVVLGLAFVAVWFLVDRNAKTV